ncbi:unnamed protein product [Polarella glacialis]|uniref:Uncharacterized protein n=1 Tax=Polarella glacialis TaxID=89957 RepID=A0A813D1X0_POLGL|nr:unnamed protein product [Polarella glacialis]
MLPEMIRGASASGMKVPTKPMSHRPKSVRSSRLNSPASHAFSPKFLAAPWSDGPLNDFEGQEIFSGERNFEMQSRMRLQLNTPQLEALEARQLLSSRVSSRGHGSSQGHGPGLETMGAAVRRVIKKTQRVAELEEVHAERQLRADPELAELLGFRQATPMNLPKLEFASLLPQKVRQDVRQLPNLPFGHVAHDRFEREKSCEARSLISTGAPFASKRANFDPFSSSGRRRLATTFASKRFVEVQDHAVSITGFSRFHRLLTNSIGAERDV